MQQQSTLAAAPTWETNKKSATAGIDSGLKKSIKKQETKPNNTEAMRTPDNPKTERETDQRSSSRRSSSSLL
jgi:hypothetical protein